MEIIRYREGLDEAFERLNREWIGRWFRVEEGDERTFKHLKDYVLGGGGEIFFAMENGEAVGCCALVHHDRENELGEWELAKMAVTERAQGRGVGNRLMEALLEEADGRGIEKIYLEGNKRLAASIHLYRKYGFREVPLKGQRYERADVLMARVTERNGRKGQE